MWGQQGREGPQTSQVLTCVEETGKVLFTSCFFNMKNVKILFLFCIHAKFAAKVDV